MQRTRKKPEPGDAEKAAGHLQQWFLAKERGDADIAEMSKKEVNRYVRRFGEALTAVGG